jgi:hypothetical protein
VFGMGRKSEDSDVGKELRFGMSVWRGLRACVGGLVFESC